MYDIEFRWLEKRRQIGTKDREGNWDTITGYTAARTLQFRTRVMQIGRFPVVAGDGDTHFMREKPMGWSWTDWQDVPVEVVNE